MMQRQRCDGARVELDEAHRTRTVAGDVADRLVGLEVALAERQGKRTACAETRADPRRANNEGGRDSQAPQRAFADHLQHRLVDDTQHPHNLLDAVSRAPFGDRGDEVERALGVGDAGGRMEEADGTESAGVVPAAARRTSVSLVERDVSRRGYALLRPRHGVQVEVDPQAVLPRPLDRLEDVCAHNAKL